MTIEIKYKSTAYISLIASICFHLLLIIWIVFSKSSIKNKVDVTPVFSEVFTDDNVIKKAAPVYSSIPKTAAGASITEGNSSGNNNKQGTQEIIKTSTNNPGGSGTQATANKTPLPGSNIITANGSGEGVNINSGRGNGGAGTGSGAGSGIGTYGTANAGGKELAKLPFIPRQILEVLPKNNESASGEISVHLKINTDGTVKEHKIVKNTLNNPERLNSVLKALYKSRWEAVTYKGSKVEYWIEKTYTFNK
jgi:hypothetical protein